MFDHLEQELAVFFQTKQEYAARIEEIVGILAQVKGKTVISGVGKTGIIGQLFASGLRSIGINCFFVHATEASHGDLGVMDSDDCLVIFSKSGNSTEIFDLLHFAQAQKITSIAICMNKNSPLARKSSLAFCLRKPQELPPVDIMPTTSNIIFSLVAETIKSQLARVKGFGSAQFLHSHPGGKIGLSRLKLEDYLNKNTLLPSVSPNSNLQEISEKITQGHYGAVVVIQDKHILGLITDGDLRRHIAYQGLMEIKADSIMNPSPIIIDASTDIASAEKVLAEKAVNQILISKQGKVIGMLHLGDIIRYELAALM